MRFTELGLEPLLLSGIEKLKYDECTPIQADCLPPILEGRDVAGLAQTGTGKTAAFLIPLMDRILKSRVSTETMTPEQKAEWTKRSFQDWRAQNFVLVLVPTRELAEQVQENVQKLSIDSGLRGVSIYGGTAYDKQKDAMRNGVEFVVATPGRLIDLFKDHVVDLKQVRAVVFDEADRMFDMGFKDDMKFILERIPRERQFLVFSATLNFEVTNTAYQFGADPIEVNVSRDQTRAENVKDEIYHCGGDEKNMFLLSLLKKNNPKQAIIFSNYKFSVERIARFLSANGIPAMGISSLLTQVQRNRVLEQFKAENEKNILVATDVAARGLDIKGVDLVINYDIPNDAESYVHRIGRTGRAGADGTAFSLVSDKDVEGLERVQEYLKNKLPVGWLDETELVRDFKNVSYEERSYDDRGPRDQRSSRPPRSGDRPQRGGGDRPHGDRKPHASGRPQGDRKQGERPHRGDRPQQQGDRPRTHAPRAQADGKPQRGPGPRPQHAKAGGESRQQGEGRAQHAHGNGKGPQHKGPRPQRAQGASHPHKKHTPPPKTITQKVTGFFKKLLGS